MPTLIRAAALSVLAALAFAADPPASQPSPPAETRPVTAGTARSPLDFTMPDIDGRDVPLKRYRGQVVLIVNVASRCGLTPQYEQLQALHRKYHAQGLTVLAFPANNFAGQEPGTAAQIKEFCTTKYGVEFPLFAKVSVHGDDQCELYKYLTSPRHNPRHAGPIQWNFTKFLIDRQGAVIARFDPRTRPDAPEVIQALESALAAKP
jgi:glutathione peroxidase